MLAALLSLLGVGSLGGIVWMVGPLKALGFVKSAASGIGAAFKSFFGMLNAQGWVGLIVCSIATGFLVHQWSEARHWHKQSDQYQKLYNAELAHEAKIAKQALDLKAKIEALSANISSTLKEQHDAQDRRISADADAVRLRGPGKATCPGNPIAPAISGGHDQAAPTGPNAGPQVPPNDRAAVPWNWLVTVIQEHDQLLNEVETWRENDKRQRETWPTKSQEPSPK